MSVPVWDWIVIVGCYLFAACFLHLMGGFNSAGEAIARWGRHSSIQRLSRLNSRYRASVR